MRRYLIVLGDKTTAGGVVIQAEESHRNHGKPLAYHGAQIYCHACKTTGHIYNVPPYRPMELMGKQVALENDICICKCNPPPRLIASQHNASMSFESGELAAMGLHSNGSAIAKEERATRGAFDERFVLKDGRGNRLADTHYTIRLPSGELKHGATDSQGYTLRYQTDSAGNIAIYLGHKQEA
ncbi:PAAR domain-containing protein [Paraburkholderia hayleyella]|uniref:PAAR domain-containing protein n=1 Tax=Paraburkholderia hayleyella TaxID=2152889 RepID=UPI00157FEAB0|nr:PAAR domain-containing protein [Paraburkholderia hayleyella]